MNNKVPSGGSGTKSTAVILGGMQKRPRDRDRLTPLLARNRLHAAVG